MIDKQRFLSLLVNMFFLGVSGVITLPASAAGPLKECYGALSYAYTLLEDVSGNDSGTAFTGGYEDGYSLLGAFGCSPAGNDNVRLELELGYTSTGYDFISGLGVTADVSGDIDILSGSVGGYFDLPVSETLKPYLGGGIGVIGYDIASTTVTLGSTQVTTAGESDSALSMFAEMGVGVAVTDTITVAPNIRYSWFDTGECGDGCTIDNDTAWMYKLTARFSF